MSLIAQTRSYARTTVLATMTTTMLAGAQVHRRVLGGDAGRRAFEQWRTVWATSMLTNFGVRSHVQGATPAPRRRARLVVANHRSPLDILLALRLVGGTVVSRADLAHWPVLGVAARAADTIFVNRDDARSGVAAIRQMRARLQDAGCVILFPEGGTFEGDRVRPFHAGVLAAARGLEVEVVPVGFAYEPGCEFVDESFAGYMMRMSGRAQTRVGIAIGSPKLLAGPRKDAVAKLHDDVQTLVSKARMTLNDGQAEGGTA